MVSKGLTPDYPPSRGSLQEFYNQNKKNIARHIHTEVIATEYSEEYDAYYNPATNEWIESKCDDPTCEFCANRPERPLLRRK
jgi:hypothetical protein